MLENVELTILAIACLPTNPTASIQLFDWLKSYPVKKSGNVKKIFYFSKFIHFQERISRSS